MNARENAAVAPLLMRGRRAVRGVPALNIFHSFLTLNRKPSIRKNKAQAFWAHLLAAEVYAGIGLSP